MREVKLPNIFERLYNAQPKRYKKKRTNSRNSSKSSLAVVHPSRLSLTPTRSYSPRSARSSVRSSSRQSSRRVSLEEKGKRRKRKRASLKKTKPTTIRLEPKIKVKSHRKRNVSKKKRAVRRKEVRKSNRVAPSKRKTIDKDRLKLVVALLTPRKYREGKFDCHHSIAKIIREFCPSILLRRIKNRDANGFQNGISL